MNPRSSWPAALVTPLVLIAVTAAAAAQCPAPWTAPGTGTDGVVRALAVLPDGDLVVGGRFTLAGGVPAAHIARWDGSAWWPLGSGMSGSTLPVPVATEVSCLLVLPNGDLIAGGNFAAAGGVAAIAVARWDGSAWSALGPGTFGWVRSLAALPNGDLVAGGGWVTAGTNPQHVARWDGSTWSALGSGVNTYQVLALAALPGGDLIAGGNFWIAGGVTVNQVARWNGSAWSAMGSGMGGGILGTSVDALVVMPDGDVIAGGNFTTAGGVTCNRVARWNGSTWSALGSGIDLGRLGTRVAALALLPDGDVVAAGTFASAGGVPAVNLARWNGSSWQPLGAGTDGVVLALAAPAAGELWAGGVFTTVDGVAAARVAVRTPTCRAAAVVSGSGCTGGGGPTQLAARGLPWVGAPFRARATGLPAGALAVAVYGFQPLALPMPAVHPLGVPGCVLRVQDDILLSFPPSGGAVDTTIVVPADLALAGGVFHHQVVPVELDGNGALAALTATNALVLTIGAL